MKKVQNLFFIIFFLSLILPNITFAQSAPPPSTSFWDSVKNLSICSLWGCSPNQNASRSVPTTQAVSPYSYNSSGGLGGVLSWLGFMLRLVLPLIISLAVVWFMWNVFQYTIREGEEEKEKAKTQIVWGIIGIFVMVSVWGLVNILRSTFNLGNSNISVPSIQADITY